jgi:hypothetical protein
LTGVHVLLLREVQHRLRVGERGHLALLQVVVDAGSMVIASMVHICAGG